MSTEEIFTRSKDMAVRLYVSHKYEESLKYFIDANDMREEEFVVSYADALIKTRLIFECKKYCETIIQEGFKYEQIISNLAYIYWNLGRNEESIILLIDLVKSFPNSPCRISLITFMWKFYDRKKFERQIEKLVNLKIMHKIDISEIIMVITREESKIDGRRTTKLWFRKQPLNFSTHGDRPLNPSSATGRGSRA